MKTIRNIIFGIMAILFIGYKSKQNEINRHELEIEYINTQEISNTRGFLSGKKNIFRELIDGIRGYFTQARTYRVNKVTYRLINTLVLSY